MYAISSYHGFFGNTHTNKPTDRTDYNTKLSAQCNKYLKSKIARFFSEDCNSMLATVYIQYCNIV